MLPSLAHLSRRRFLAGAATVAAAASLPGRLLAQAATQAATAADPLDALRARLLAPALQRTQLAPGIWVIQGDGGNIAVSTGKDGKLVVDSGVQPGSSLLLEQLHSIDAAPLHQLVNTHWHFDHTDGNADLHAAGATIIAQQQTQVRLSTPQYMDIIQHHFPAAPPAARPTVTFDQTKSLPWNGDTILLTHFEPAHTDTDIFVSFPAANVIHTGDVFFAGVYPLIDYSTGGRIDGMIAASDVLLKASREDTKIIPGHGPVQTRKQLQAYRDMLSTVRDRVAKAKSEGKSVEEVQKLKPTAEFDAERGAGMLSGDQFTMLVYRTV